MEDKPFYVSPPSSTSSPAHEFSFTISLHQQPPSLTSAVHDRLNPPPPPPPPFSTAVDLSPADTIFFHGHLLPLHLLSHFPIISPRSSANSVDSFTQPERDIVLEEDEHIFNGNISFQGVENTNFHNNLDDSTATVNEGEIKSKSFSLFSLSKWRKSRQADKNDQENKRKKKKLKFDVVNHVLKRYLGMMRPLLSFRSTGSRRSSSAIINRKFAQQPHSFSGSTSSRYNQHKFSRGEGRRGQFSAPASLRTSPANSGPLVASGGLGTPTSESSMEELQAAIQAAITHCKNSIAMDDKKNKCQN